MWTCSSILLSFHLLYPVECLHNARHLIRAWRKYNTNYSIWSETMRSILTFVNCMRTADVAAVWQLLSYCTIWMLVPLALCHIFHHFFPSTLTHCSDFLNAGCVPDNILIGSNSMGILWIKTGHEIKGKEIDFSFSVEIHVIFFFIWCFVSLWVFFDIHDDWRGCIFFSPTLEVLIIPVDMIDNRCKMSVSSKTHSHTVPHFHLQEETQWGNERVEMQTPQQM